jgi:hypothetical protein
VAELAEEVLAASAKLLKLLMDYMTTVYHNLVELSGFLPQDAWSLTTQAVCGIFIYMSNALGSKVCPNEPQYRLPLQVSSAHSGKKKNPLPHVLASVESSTLQSFSDFALSDQGPPSIQARSSRSPSNH